MKVKGIELLKMIADGKIKDTTRIRYADGGAICDYLNYILNDIMDEDFEILEDKTEEIEEIQVDENGFIKTETGTWKGRKLDIAFVNKLNEISEKVNKLNKQDTSKETNCMTD